MKHYKHNKEWYVKVHNILAAVLLVGGFTALIIICGLLENI